FRARSGNAVCRFGYRARIDGTSDGGDTVGLAEKWDVHSSPANGGLDYHLVRLARKVGDEPVGSFVNAPKRLWLSRSVNEVSVGQSLYVLQHPKGDTIKTAEGGLVRRDQAWIEYNVNTDKGSSGSPVLNNLWQPIALHSRSGTGEVN